MVKLLGRARRPLLRVIAPPGSGHSIEVDSNMTRSPPHLFTELLGLILAQAINDGMWAVSVGASITDGSVYLKYYGPSARGMPTWWEMTPPPTEAYTRLVKAVVEATVFEGCLEPRGTIHAQINEQRIDVTVEIRNWFDINLNWDANGVPGEAP